MGSGQMPNLGTLNDMRLKAINTPILGGPTVSQVANIGGGIYHGANALSGLMDNSNAQKDLNSLKSDITLAMASNPMYDMYLDASDQKLLRQMKNDRLEGTHGGTVKGIVNSLPKALLNTGLGFLAGGPAGAAIQGIGTLANAGISGYGQGIDEQYAQLQGLYDKLQRANDDYLSMKRPRGLRQAGLQSQYFNQLY